MIPSHFHLQYSRLEIEEQVARLGRQVVPWVKQTREESHTDILTIPVLRGGIFFFADLVRQIDGSVEIAPIRTWAYEAEQNQVEPRDVRVNLEGVAALGRKVLLVDDICDSGSTLQKLSTVFLEAGAAEVRSAVLIKRALKEQQFEPDWVGFEFDGDEWFVGYGMDDSERWRNLPDIYIIRS